MKKSKRLVDKPVVDHCHTTNKVRALLHGMCNMLVGLVEVHNTKVDCAIVYADKWHKKHNIKVV